MLGLVIKREFSMLFNSRAQRITTILMAAVILIAGIVGRYLLTDDGEDGGPGSTPDTLPTYTVGVEESASGLAPLVDAIDGIVTAEVISDGEGASWLEAKVPDADDDAYFAVVTGTPQAPQVIFPNAGTPDTEMGDYLQTALTLWTTDAVAGPIDAEQANAIANTGYTVQTQILDIGTDSNLLVADPIGYITSIVSLVFLSMAVLGGLSTIAIGVVEEKASRVVEILLTSIRPRTLLLGKILGIGAFLLGQLLIFIAAAVIALNIAGLWIDLDLGATIASTIVWTVLGFFIFAMVAGALSSTVSRQEDLGAITAPLSFGALIPIYLAMFLVPAQPDSTLTQVLSFIPFISSFMMPTRAAYGVVTTTEQVIAAVIALVAIPLLAMLAGKIYQNSILRTGQRVSIAQALKSES